jgi:hypothetical protein
LMCHLWFMWFYITVDGKEVELLRYVHDSSVFVYVDRATAIYK